MFFRKFLRKHLIKGLKRDEKGAAAIEFALVALPFFAILFATFEIAMIYWAQGVLTESVEPQARRGMTGELQRMGGVTQQNLRTAICNNVGGMFDCNRLIIDVRTLPNFTAQGNPSLLTAGGSIIPTEFDFGARGDIVMMRVGYPWQTIFPFSLVNMSFNLSNMPNGIHLMQVTHVVRNEKF